MTKDEVTKVTIKDYDGTDYGVSIDDICEIIHYGKISYDDLMKIQKEVSFGLNWTQTSNRNL